MFRLYIYVILSLCTVSILLVLLEFEFLQFDNWGDPEEPPEVHSYVKEIQSDDQPLVTDITTGKYFLMNSPIVLKTLIAELQSCKIPVLNPFDGETMKRINALYYGRPICMDESGMKFWTDLDSNLLRKPKHEGFWRLVDCCYTVFKRDGDDMFVNSSAETCYPVTDDRTRIPATHEFIRVLCKNKDRGGFAYEDFFGFVHRKPDIEKRATAAATDDDQLSIIILGLDSVSHMNFQRFMPTTRDFLLNKMSAIEFYGRNKVHESTFANVVPTLTGWTTEELKDNLTCWPTHDSHFDNCPFIWKDFMKRGYRSLYGEDSIHRSTFLDSTLNGFKEPIADYDFRTLIRGMELLGGGDGCFRHQSSTQILINSIAKAATRFRGKPYFHWTWITSFTHESAQGTKHADEHVLKLLKTLRETHLLNRTLFVLMSDHGMTFGPYVELEQGMLESRMPMLNLVFPDWFSNKYSKALANLKQNTRRLTTPFDLHAMLKDLLHPVQTISNPVLEGREAEFYSKFRGISLFLPIPLNRTCSMAGIDDHWCICWTKTPVINPTQDPDVLASVTFSVDFINSKLKSFHNCAQVRLASVVLARRLNPESTQFTAKVRGVKKYEVLFKVIPSSGIFEATVVLENGKGPAMGGPVSRINAYKKQGDCIDTTTNGTLEIKSMCFCIS